MMELMEVPPQPPMQPTTPNANHLDEFLQTGRTGRRNAVPEIDCPAGEEAALSGGMEKLSCSESASVADNSKSGDQPTPGTSNQGMAEEAALSASSSDNSEHTESAKT